jgi:hypothetical protein
MPHLWLPLLGQATEKLLVVNGTNGDVYMSWLPSTGAGLHRVARGTLWRYESMPSTSYPKR